MILWAIKRPNGFQPTGDLHIEAFDKLQNGQIYKLTVSKERSPGFHRKFMSMVRLAFDYWEPGSLPDGVFVEKDFDAFREKLVIAAGFYKQVFSLNGKSFELKAKSIAWDQMDDSEFREVFNAVLEVIINSPDIVPVDPNQAALFRDQIVSYLT